MSLVAKRCVPCEGGVPKLDGDAVNILLSQIDGWSVLNDKLRRTLEFDDFLAAMKFVNEMAELAESEAHHPDFCVHYNQVDITVWTHAIGGLSENDFILAAKIDELTERSAV